MEENKVILTVDVNGTKAEQGLKAVDKELKSTGNTAKTTSKDLKGVDDALDALPGAAGNAAQGVKGLLTQFKALIANPVGLTIAAIAGALALVYKGLSTLSPVVDAFENTMSGLSSTMDTLFGNIGKFLSGNKDAALSLQDSYKYGVQAAKAMRDYEDGVKDLNLQNVIYDRQIDLLIRKAKNQALSEKQRNDLLKEALRLQDEQIIKNRQVLKAEGEAIAFRVKAQGGSFKQLMEIQKGASVAGMNIQNQQLEDLLFQYQEYTAKRIQSETQFELTKERVKNSFDANELKAEKTKTVKVISEEEKRQQDFLEKYNRSLKDLQLKEQNESNEQDRLKEERQQAEIDAEKDLENQKIDIANDGAKKRQEIADIEAQNRISTIAAIGGALQGFAQLAGEQSKEAKALAVANALINTYMAANQVLGDKTLPTVAKAFAVAGIVASGLANVRKIAAIDPKGKGGGSQSASAPPPIVKPTSSFTTINNEEPIPTIGKGSDTKVYVTETDISNTQNKVNGIKAKATL